MFVKKSLTLHPDKNQVATGQVGKAPQIIVWDSTTLKPTSILKGGHTDGVGILTFDLKGEVCRSFWFFSLIHTR